MELLLNLWRIWYPRHRHNDICSVILEVIPPATHVWRQIRRTFMQRITRQQGELQCHFIFNVFILGENVLILNQTCKQCQCKVFETLKLIAWLLLLEQRRLWKESRICRRGSTPERAIQCSAWVVQNFRGSAHGNLLPCGCGLFIMLQLAQWYAAFWPSVRTISEC